MRTITRLFISATCFVTAHSVLASDPPGVVINESPDFKQSFVGNPSVAILPDGNYVATHDWFGPGASKTQTVVFSSRDRGETWSRIAIIEGQNMSTLFVHRSELFLMGTDRPYGNVIIRRSADDGKTWTNPTDKSNGLLLDDKMYQTSPLPMTVHNGRIWRSVDQFLNRSFRSMVVSVPVDADLLDAANWLVSNPIAAPDNLFGGPQDRIIQANIMAQPDGSLVSMFRVKHGFQADIAAMIPVSNDGKTFEPRIAERLVEFPGGRAKFTIRFDPKSKRYWSLVNKQRSPFAIANIVALISSADLRQWDVKTVVLHHTESSVHGFSKIDWQFDGNDLIAVSATAWTGSTSIINANFLTFHRVENFRTLTADDAPQPYGPFKNVTSEHNDFRIDGTNYRIKKFKNGEPTFINRMQYRWTAIPTKFEGSLYTQISAGNQSELT